jgi:hypothetical protein
MASLSEQARRLDRSLKVAVMWMEAAHADSSEMWAKAQYARDSIEEELSCVCFEMAVEEEAHVHARAYENQTPERREGRRYRDEDLPEVARLSALSDMLLSTYCELRDLETDHIGDGSTRARYGLMGALLVAQDIANTEMERLEVKPGEVKASV